MDAKCNKPAVKIGEEITFTAPRTQLFLHADKSEGMGTLYVTTKFLIWQSEDRSAGYRFDYPYMLLHAIQRDPQAFPHPCIYAQLDDEVAEEAFATASMRQQASAAAAEEAAEADEDAADEAHPISDLRFVPENAGLLDAMYHAMSECAKLNPDSDLSDGEGDFMYNAEEIQNGFLANAGGGDDEEEEEAEYGEGGDDGGAAYGIAGSNADRLAQLAMRTGVSAEDMFADAEEEEGEEGEEEEEEEEEVLRAKGAPANGQAQLDAAAQQVQAAGASARPKRERYEEATAAETTAVKQA